MSVDREVGFQKALDNATDFDGEAFTKIVVLNHEANFAVAWDHRTGGMVVVSERDDDPDCPWIAWADGSHAIRALRDAADAALKIAEANEADSAAARPGAGRSISRDALVCEELPARARKVVGKALRGPPELGPRHVDRPTT